VSGFAQALPVILRAEGGYVDDPLDRGGATHYGVTTATYDAWRRSKGLPVRPVRQIERGEVEAIYHEQYWVAGRCDALPWPLSLAHFDACVNHGPRNAWRIMQRALRVQDDGVPGPRTFAALQAANPDALTWAWLEARTDFYLRIVGSNPPQQRFLRGWLLHRVLGLHREMRRAT
jgi:lysozyme family protein